MPVFIEWLEGGTLLRGTVKKADRAKLQAVSLFGKTHSVPARRFHILHESDGDVREFFEDLDRKALEVDLELLHETVGPGGTFSLEQLAACWFSTDAPSRDEAAILLSACIQGSPWFKVEGSGRVHSCSAEDIDRMRREREAKERLEEEVRRLTSVLVGKPGGDAEDLEDRVVERLRARFLGEQGADEWPALEEALRGAGAHQAVSTTDLIKGFLGDRGKLPEPYLYHMVRFHRAFFGSPLKETEIPPCKNRYPGIPRDEIDRFRSEAGVLIDRLPPSLHDAVFSVDDEGVEEIDDALSVQVLEKDRFRVGVHIAAPGFVIPEESRAHAQALSRCVTVYQPDLKWAMLPREVIDIFSLREGKRVPAVSTYFTFGGKDFEPIETEVRAESLPVRRNFSYDALEQRLEGGFFPELEALDEDPGRVHAWLDRNPREFPWTKNAGLPSPASEALDLLVPLARHLFLARNRGGAGLFNRIEYRIKVSPEGEITIRERKRNGIVEGVVAELMILTNGWTAARLAEAEMPAIYRTQRRVAAGDQWVRTQADLTVIPREHAGLGTGLYCWATSPIRRYADLLNQRQISSLIGGPLPAFRDASELLVRAKRTEFQNNAADEHQARMERFWTLKVLESRGDRLHPVEVELQQDRFSVRFQELPLRIFLSPEEWGGGTPGPKLFLPERFDFYALNVKGRIESA